MAMMHDVPRWLRDLALALEQASAAVAAPRDDLDWHLLRCRDTLRMDGQLRAQSLWHLVTDLAATLRGYPTDLPEPLLNAAMTAPGQGFRFALLRAEALALGVPGAPRWSSVTISAPLELSPAQRLHVSRTDLVTADAYEERFAQLLSLGHSWINLSSVGLLRGVLLVTVETPADRRTETLTTSVNVSGPAAFVQQRAGWDLDGLILLEGDP